MAKTPEQSSETIYVLNGPNLNLLGTREPDTYGHATLADVERICAEAAAEFGLKADCRQSNREGELVDFIHEAHAKKAAGIIINAGAYSHTSIALHDALKAVKVPAVEVHISNIHARESFRHHSFTAMAAFATLSGFGIEGYRLAISGLAARIGAKGKREDDSLTRHPDTTPDASPSQHARTFGSRSWRASRTTRQTKTSSDDSALIRELAALLDETSLTEIEIERSGLRLRVARNVTVAAAMPAAFHAGAAPMASATASASAATSDLSKHPGVVPSPMVGSVYRSPEPGAEPFVEVGDKVAVGQTLMIIEAMKTMNPIPAPRAGKVTRSWWRTASPWSTASPSRSSNSELRMANSE